MLSAVFLVFLVSPPSSPPRLRTSTAVTACLLPLLSVIIAPPPLCPAHIPPFASVIFPSTLRLSPVPEVVHRNSYEPQLSPIVPVTAVRGRRPSLGSSGGGRSVQELSISTPRRPHHHRSLYLFVSIRLQPSHGAVYRSPPPPISKGNQSVKIGSVGIYEDSRRFHCRDTRGRCLCFGGGRSSRDRRFRAHLPDPSARPSLIFPPLLFAVSLAIRFSYRYQLSVPPAPPLILTGVPPALPSSAGSLHLGSAALRAQPSTWSMVCFYSPKGSIVGSFWMGSAQESSNYNFAQNRVCLGKNPIAKGLYDSGFYRSSITSSSLGERTFPSYLFLLKGKFIPTISSKNLLNSLNRVRGWHSTSRYKVTIISGSAGIFSSTHLSSGPGSLSVFIEDLHEDLCSYVLLFLCSMIYKEDDQFPLMMYL